MDVVRRFLFEDLDIRGALVQLGPAWRQMQAERGYGETTRALLGELAAVTTIIASTLKTPGRLTFHLRGHGPVRLLLVDCDEQLRLRGIAKTPADLATAPISELFGDGQLALTLDTNNAREPYQSIVPLAGNTVAAVFEHYLMQSEQTPSRLWLMADAAHACGLFLQRLPGADARDADGWNRVQQLAATVVAAELALPAETLLTRLFPDEDIRLFEPRTVSFHCPRDEDKVLEMLRLLGRAEIEAALAEHGEMVISDDICNQEYRYGAEILDVLFPPAARTLH
ncbi:MAG: Hsp33 family molecular chaperone HslO [Gammaproteobacteria bacterium]|nr:Hsp33 family molecular chaperone HslO [Gammaproteobacteria bacterium]MBU1414029.1 Hsp33 family molecular chaperone HslO [Gammaproteobacteria bacterium]